MRRVPHRSVSRPWRLLAGIVAGRRTPHLVGGLGAAARHLPDHLMVMGHEFGHFITAKRAGLLVTDFFVGFGPVVWSTQRGETRYGVRALLLGGYVKVPGMTWGIPGRPGDRAAARTARPPTRRRSSSPRPARSCTASWRSSLAWAALTFIGVPSASHVGVLAFTPWQGHDGERGPARGAQGRRPDRRGRRHARSRAPRSWRTSCTARRASA